MKKAFTIIAALGMALSSAAQLTVFKDNFDNYTNYTITGGWSHVKSDIIPWRAGIPYLVGGACFGIPEISNVACIAEACNSGFDRNNSDVLMYTPAINTNGMTKLWLRYDSYFKKVSYGGGPETATVEVSTDGGINWTVIQNVPANTDPKAFSTYFLDLTAYINISDLRIGFRYSDAGGARRGWAIDNVEVFEPADKDLVLTSVTPTDDLLSYCETGKSVMHTATIFNNGTDPIQAFDVEYLQDNGPVYKHTESGLNIAPFATYTFTHSVPDTIWTAGSHNVTMYAGMQGEQNLADNFLSTTVHGASFIPPKRIVIEQGSATWNAYAPEGLYLMDQYGQDPDILPILVHDTDPMAIPDYCNYLYTVNNTYNYIPYYLFDRKRSVTTDSMTYYTDKYSEYFGFADIYADAVLNGSMLEVNTHVRPAIDLDGDYRLLVVITEDGVTGTDSGYAQKNIFAGGSIVMGGYETMSNPVPAGDMRYNFVARKVIPSPVGAAGVLPAKMEHEQTYHHIFRTQLEPGWGKQLKATVILMDYTDQVILNSFRTMFYLGVQEKQHSLSAGIYPNPAREEARIYFDQEQDKKVQVLISDMTGKTMWTQSTMTVLNGRNEIRIPTAQLAPGMYIVNLVTGEERTTMKLQVVR